MIVAVLGASDNPEKYSSQALKLLREKGHEVFPVNPSVRQIEGQKVYASLEAVPKAVDTLTMYVSRAVSSKMAGQILQRKPRRVIFNPGAENPALEADLAREGIKTVEACTLVLLRTNQFDKISNP